MTTSSHSFQVEPATLRTAYEHTQPTLLEPQPAPNSAELRPVRPAQGNRHDTEQSLRMYTEEQVAEMLQVSLSQLRKWRLKQYQGHRQGPPFRKIGRLVRYPEAALRVYINGERLDPAV